MFFPKTREYALTPPNDRTRGMRIAVLDEALRVMRQFVGQVEAARALFTDEEELKEQIERFTEEPLGEMADLYRDHEQVVMEALRDTDPELNVNAYMDANGGDIKAQIQQWPVTLQFMVGDMMAKFPERIKAMAAKAPVSV